ncbi:MAG: hypothetical protein KA096_00590 [Bacteroidales bacterium]|nr:hypothetical protein [Bacteroidales bacterium]
MDQKKLEKLENIKNYLENDDISGLNKYIERIKPMVKDDEDFQDIFEELKGKNYDQALFLAEEFIYETDEDSENFGDDFDKVDLEDFDDKNDLMLEGPGDDLEEFDEDLNDDFSEDQFDDLAYYEDKDDDYY